ncbi:aminotransferase class V-fold PLP-dependent enzyme, partial [Roseomonas sp. DSM 102946]|nr:aminotransferase class V-fold PLP-dependent enzyme [Roseomonas sp. DSM 102946]
MDGSVASAGFDVARVRKDFPILSTTHRGKPLVFLDSGASAQKPRAVIEAMKEMMETAYANVHRGAYHLSEQATEAYEAARRAAARFLNAADEREIVLTGTGSTQAINLVAHSFGRGVLKSGQAVLVSE